MKKAAMAIALSSALLAGNAFSADEPKSTSPMDQFDEHKMQMHNDQMEAHLKEMQVLMDKLHATKDPAERQRLLDEHRKQMRELMQGMHSSRDDMVMGMMGGGARHGGSMPQGEKRRQHMIEKRLDMMDNAMEMMMRRDEMMMRR
jgi:prenyltransferase beta subunit